MLGVRIAISYPMVKLRRAVAVLDCYRALQRGKTPARLLNDYFGRTDIETVIKIGKEYVNLLPLFSYLRL